MVLSVDMRILFSTWPAHGHLLPMLPLARAAQRAGHDVVIATGAEMVHEVRRRNFESWDVGPSREEAGAAFAAVVPDLTVIEPAQRVPTMIAGVFGAAALQRARALVPRAMAWRPDLVVHPITELAGAVAAELCGASRLVHGFGPLPAEAWTWFGARFGELCERWGVPALTGTIFDSPFIELCPPSLQRDAVAAFRNRVPMRPAPVTSCRASACRGAPSGSPRCPTSRRCTSRWERCSITTRQCSGPRSTDWASCPST